MDDHKQPRNSLNSRGESRSIGESHPLLIDVSLNTIFYSHRTLVPLQYPPHVVALGCIYVAALLSSFEQPESPRLDNYLSSKYLAEMFNQGGDWENKYHAHVEDLQGNVLSSPPEFR